jgi:hypothetical protein
MVFSWRFSLQIHCALKGLNYLQSLGEEFCEWNEGVRGKAGQRGVDTNQELASRDVHQGLKPNTYLLWFGPAEAVPLLQNQESIVFFS